LATKPRVDMIEAPGGNVAVIEHSHGPITMVAARSSARLFVDVPIAPPHRLVGRDEAMTELRAKLCRRDGVAAISALKGLPGVGKTTLAVALARDEAMRAHFRGGVLWAGLGPNADVDTVLNRWAAALDTDLSTAKETGERVRLLSMALQERAGALSATVSGKSRRSTTSAESILTS
jgi:Mrp family chromosome partitioning ATPase